MVDPVYGTTATIDTILDAADPMQALIDAMGFGTKPTYMWGSNQASPGDSIEIGGSGFDLSTSGILYEQTSAALGSSTCIEHNSNADHVSNGVDAALQNGTNSFAAIGVYEPTDLSALYSVFGDRDPTTGYSMRTDANGKPVLYFDTVSGVISVTETTGLTVNVGQTFAYIRDMTALEGRLHTASGSITLSSIYNENINAATQKFGWGDGLAGNGFRARHGILAKWQGAVAETITATHRNNLNTYLGLP